MTDPKQPDSANNKCSLCRPSICCGYITQQIRTPRSKNDFRFLLWQVSHRNIEIYKDSDGWFLLILNAECEHLIEEESRCAIYQQRPAICREYSNEYCEFDAPAEGGFERHFRNHDELNRYCQQRFKHWDP
jgi:Fe-S-cluster containining protein